jgi:aspartate/methionine/tyrosine aminotransferase
MFADRTRWNLKSNRWSEALARHRAAGKTLLDLTASNPTECGFEYESERILQALSDPAALKYQPDPKGLAEARRAVAGYYAARSADVSADDIYLTTSTSEAYSYLFRILCDAGDELLVPEPSYPLFGFLAEIQDVSLRRYPLVYDHGWQIHLAALESAITPRTRGIIVVNPNNPTGQFCKLREIAALNEICAASGVAIIADEVFLDFSLDTAAAQPFSFAGNRDALTFTMSGLSKISGLPQMKFAWLATSGPDELKPGALARLDVIADTFLSMNTPIQAAADVFFELRHGFQRQLMARVRENLGEFDRQLASAPQCNRLKIEGGWYAILRVPATRSDEDLAVELLDRCDVLVHPGHFYDFGADGYLIVSLIVPPREFAEGIRRLLTLT